MNKKRDAQSSTGVSGPRWDITEDGELIFRVEVLGSSGVMFSFPDADECPVRLLNSREAQSVSEWLNKWGPWWREANLRKGR